MEKAIDIKLEEKGYAAVLWSVANVFPFYLPQFPHPWWWIPYVTIMALNVIGFYKFWTYRRWFLITIVLNYFALWFTGHFTIVTGFTYIPSTIQAYWESYVYYQAHPYD